MNQQHVENVKSSSTELWEHHVARAGLRTKAAAPAGSAIQIFTQMQQGVRGQWTVRFDP